ncbi:hypothetical protein quinque_013785 [Culex quinquefasciatus]
MDTAATLNALESVIIERTNKLVQDEEQQKERPKSANFVSKLRKPYNGTRSDTVLTMTEQQQPTPSVAKEYHRRDSTVTDASTSSEGASGLRKIRPYDNRSISMLNSSSSAARDSRYGGYDGTSMTRNSRLRNPSIPRNPTNV